MTLFKSLYFWRTYLFYILISFSGILFFAVYTAQKYAVEVQAELDQRLVMVVELLAESFDTPFEFMPAQDLMEITAVMAEATELRLTIINSQGLVLSDSHEDPVRMDNHRSRPEIQSALIYGNGRAARLSYTLDEDFHYLARTISVQDALTGFVRAAYTEQQLEQAINQKQLSLFKNSSFLAFFLSVAAFYLSARQASKLEEITIVAEDIAGGDFSRRAAKEKAAGFSRLSEAINQMARSSEHRVNEVTTDRNRLAAIFRGMVEGVIDIDQDQRILHINDAAARLLDIERNASIGQPIWQEIRNQEIINSIDESIKKNEEVNCQVNLNLESRQDPKVVNVYIASLSNNEGQPIGALLVLNDITELTSLERVRTDFVANASHELKTPITAIRGLTETILEDDKASRETMFDFMRRVHAQSLRLSQLVADLMTISRLESSQQNDDFESVNMSELVKHSFKIAKAVGTDKGHHMELVVNDANGKLEVFGDRQNLCQLVDNLIDNAIKYTQEPGEISVRLEEQDKQMVLSVEDSGVGISPQHQKRVFERFYRIDKVRSQSLGGTGLGLSIAKNIVEKHNGRLELESQLGKGSTFIFTMPLISKH